MNMTTKEFIERIADGTYTQNDVIIQSAQFPDKEDLVWDLYLADKLANDITGRPIIEDETQIKRLDRAISIISKEYQINIFEDKARHPLSVNISIPDEIDSDLFRAFIDISIRNEVISYSNSTIRFNGSYALLAFACGRIFCDDTIRLDSVTKDPIVNRGDKFFPQAKLNKLFGCKRLSQVRHQFIGKTPPTGYEKIVNLLSKAEEIINAHK
jgi:hypothetical protein